MKLLFCRKCQDVFKLDFEIRSCKCGLVRGKYIDNVRAVSNGKGFSLAINNYSLGFGIGAIDINQSKKYEVDCWLRQNSGPGNENMYIDENL